MREFLSSRFLLLVCRFVLGMVFIVAAVPKIAQPGSFAAAVEAYELLPLAAVNAAAVIIPWIELVGGLFLVAGVYPRAGAALLGILLLFFIGAIGIAVTRGLHINCGCFGGANVTEVGWGRLLEDVALLVPAALILVFGDRPESPEPGTAAGDGTDSRPA